MHNSGVVIAGCGAISAAGRGLEALRAALKQNHSGLRPVERFSASRFQSAIAGAVLPEWRNPQTWQTDDPAWSLAAEALGQARLAAGDIPVSAERVGLVCATTKANIEALERISRNEPCSEAARRHLQADLLARDLAAAHHLHGPMQTVSVACVSGLTAIWQATSLIRRGAADAMFVVGVDALSEFVVAGFTALKALDPLGCRPFDRDRKGLSPGEAGAAILLIREDLAALSPTAAMRPVIKISGYGGSNDANHLTGPSRDGSGLAHAIRRALDSAALSPSDINLVHAHGTGTPYNDAMESLALKTIFETACPPVSAAKGLLGHTLGAAGVIETICCVLALQNGFLPGIPRLEQAAEGTPSSLVHQPRTAPLKTVLKLNTGFGGMNAALVLQKI